MVQKKKIMSGVFKLQKDYNFNIIIILELQFLLYPNTHQFLKTKVFSKNMVVFL